MTKHLIGVGLFVSIVGISVLTNAVLTLPPIPSLDPAVSPQAKLPTHCKFGRLNPIGKTRAIADRRTGEVTIYVNSIPGAAQRSESELNASFAFYVIRNEKVTLADVINDQLVNSVSRDNDTKWIVRYTASWIKDLSREDTLYIEPSVGDAHRQQKIAPPFSKDAAIAVLIQN